jgi:hypothetical protein
MKMKIGKLDMIDRKKMVLAMELLARCINDEEVFESWLVNGVADGDINSFSTDINEVEDCYIEDETLIRLMDCFLDVMSAARKSGGLYIDTIVSKRG